MSQEASLMYEDFLTQDDTNKDAPIEYYIEWLVDTINDLRRMLNNKAVLVTALVDRQMADAKVIADLEGQIERLEGGGFEERGV
jgi:phosphoenolpyruvate synthase/pyruvate phosphate dikinase